MVLKRRIQGGCLILSIFKWILMVNVTLLLYDGKTRDFRLG
jgi:hypothetical protein